MNLKRLIFSILVLTGAVIAGCAVNQTETANGAPLARQITASDQCGVGSGGLTYLERADELTRLGQWPVQNLSMKSLRTLNFDREHLLVVGLGQKPTGGFGLTLANSQIAGSTLKLTVILRRPPADAMVTQALTTPCAVIAITPKRWQALEVSGNGLDTLRLKR